MSQVETNHDSSETLTTACSGYLNGDCSRDPAKANSGIPIAGQENYPFCEGTSVCSQFLVKLSHEMRTPLSSILGVAQIMLEASLGDSQREFAETVAESAHALIPIAEAIADFANYLALQNARLQAHQIELNGNDVGSADHSSNGNSSKAVARIAAPSSRGAEDMPSKAPTDAGRLGTFRAAANFSTRVPPDTAKLIRILVVEDHLMNQRVMLRMLARLGYTADAVCNGVEAVAALTRSPYDIVLMDCQMPELDGYEATRQIRKCGGRFRSTPIIAVTANAMDGDREKCLASGMSDYMSKPVLTQTLATTLEKWILPDAAAGVGYSAKAPPAAASHRAPASGTQTRAQPDSQPAAGEAMNAAPAELGEAVDPGALETLRSMDAGDEGFMAKIIELFLADLSERIDALKVAAQTRDGDALGRIAHALKGSCGHFGATRLAALCRKMEQIGAQQPVGDASEVLLELQAEAGRVRIALEEAKKLTPPNSALMEEPD
jgi:CheY-like chemotaxis protein